MSKNYNQNNNYSINKFRVNQVILKKNLKIVMDCKNNKIYSKKHNKIKMLIKLEKKDL